ncbi:MAG: glycosyltransferase, partial [Myxococcaceae bacterium]|nr:glycosyltransferase [Myxococcaceae bacterium]
MRLLHVLPTRVPAYGGPVRVAEALVAQLQRAGHDARLFPSLSEEGPLTGRTGYWPGLRALRGLERAIRCVDLVHVHCLWTVTTSAAALLARAHGIPYVVTPHGMLDRWSLRRGALRKRLYAWAVERANLECASAVHFFNVEERDEAAGFGIRAPAWVLPNGVDADAFIGLPGRPALDAHLPEVRGRTVALFLGRIHPKKGFDLLLPALARARRSVPGLHLVVAGPDEGGYRGRVEQEVQRLGLSASVSFVGEVQAALKRVVLGGADVFVLSSHQEGDSVAVKEAMASGLPVLLTPACHFAE